MNYINYKTLYLDFLQDLSVVLPDHVRLQLIDKVKNVKKEQFSTKVIASINKTIKQHIKRRGELKTHKFINKNYDEDHIRYILDYQIKNKLTDTEISIQFKMSRTTLAKWKKAFKN